MVCNQDLDTSTTHSNSDGNDRGVPIDIQWEELEKIFRKGCEDGMDLLAEARQKNMYLLIGC